MGRAFEYRKARKMKRWGHMARVFTKIGKEIEIAVKAAGSDPNSNTRLRILTFNSFIFLFSISFSIFLIPHFLSPPFLSFSRYIRNLASQ